MLHLWGLYLGPHFCGAQGAPRGTRGEGREGAGVAGGRVGVLVAYWWLGLGSPDYR